MRSWLLEILKQSKLSLSTAESCTGGLIGSYITQYDGSSVFYRGGLIAYSTDLKVALLHVPQPLIDQYSVVSIPVAEAMAHGARNLFSSDYALSTTGYAGNNDPNRGKVCLAVAGPDSFMKSKCYFFEGDRFSVREQAAHCALNMLYEAFYEQYPIIPD